MFETYYQLAKKRGIRMKCFICKFERYGDNIWNVTLKNAHKGVNEINVCVCDDCIEKIKSAAFKKKCEVSE